MGSMSLAGAVVSGDELRWRSHAVVHEENRAWLTKLLEIAALVQATNVERGTDILETLELRSVTSEHPTSGVRERARRDARGARGTAASRRPSAGR